ncbi:hypothetical protein HNR63_002624, partial [Anoxybacillus kamchatkensis]|nr:hypothetical protein [Anoxybacillus ayderensis]
PKTAGVASFFCREPHKISKNLGYVFKTFDNTLGHGKGYQ